MLFPLTHDDPQGFGAYQLLARLGSGGMGTVYLARSPGGRTVALKTMHARIAADTAFRTRFRLETDAARVIGGRHGATGRRRRSARRDALAGHRVRARPAARRRRRAARARCPRSTVRALGAALCGALGQLHRSDVVHRDLKPSNIMITAYGPKIIDFGIARAIGDDRLTQTGAAAGTPAFMSPEQATGRGHTHRPAMCSRSRGCSSSRPRGTAPSAAGSPPTCSTACGIRRARPHGRTGRACGPLLARCLAKDPAQRPDDGRAGGPTPRRQRGVRRPPAGRRCSRRSDGGRPGYGSSPPSVSRPRPAAAAGARDGPAGERAVPAQVADDGRRFGGGRRGGCGRVGVVRYGRDALQEAQVEAPASARGR